MNFPSFNLSGKVALITGGDKGIGQGIAVALANAGASVAFTTRQLARAEGTLKMIEALGRPAMAAELDVTKLGMMQPAVEQVLDRFGRIDILVNNAGLNIIGHPLEIDEQTWDVIYDTNVKGLFFMTQTVCRVMAKQGGGKVINVASQAGLTAMPQRVVYCSSKAAVIHMTRVLAMELAPLKILVNAVAPTFVKTELTGPFLADPAFAAYVKEKIVLDRLANVEDVAGAVIYLASPAADMVTGATIVVDGGWTIH